MKKHGDIKILSSCPYYAASDLPKTSTGTLISEGLLWTPSDYTLKEYSLILKGTRKILWH